MIETEPSINWMVCPVCNDYIDSQPHYYLCLEPDRLDDQEES